MVDVSVVCLSYNHEKYIRKALNSILSQETTYSYEILINDDCSTDKSQEIIREYQRKYPKIIKPFFQKENQYSKGNSPLEFILSKVSGKYVMLCECDDYWCNNKKMEIQIDFLENHKDYSMCVHSSFRCYESGEISGDIKELDLESRDVTVEETISNWICDTASIAFRYSFLENPVPFRKNAPAGDYSLLVFMAMKGKVYYMNKPMSTYRLFSENSLSRRFNKNKDIINNNIIKNIELLERIDNYSNYKYHICIKQNLDSLHYEYARINFLLKEIKNSDEFQILSPIQKMITIIKSFINSKCYFLKKCYLKIKYNK